jgi:hypothetical protein
MHSIDRCSVMLVSACGALLLAASATAYAGSARVAAKAPLERTALNPQPLPPKSRATTALDRAALNPQPLPPKASPASPVDRVALNPQPLPPKASPTSRADRVALNPQPLPPKERPAASRTGRASNSDSLAQRGIIIVSGKPARGR